MGDFKPEHEGWLYKDARSENELAEAEASCDRLRAQYDEVRALNAELAMRHATMVGALRKQVAAVQAAHAMVKEYADQLFARVQSAEKQIGDMRQASDKLGSRLSAALDDPAVSTEMKADIEAWFGVMWGMELGEPIPDTKNDTVGA